MGFYQLSRLDYCFSKEKVYSNKGYPSWLFLAMYAIGICGVMSMLIAPWLLYNTRIQKCGICWHDGTYLYTAKYSESPVGPMVSVILISVAIICYLFWDFTNLLLYALKIRTFKKYENENSAIYKRIMSILYRVLILTLFYEIIAFLAISIPTAIFILNRDGHSWIASLWISGSITSVVFSYSIYLMMQHNTRQYHTFLRVIDMMRLYYLLICCKGIIIHELDGINDIQSDESMLSQEIEAQPIDKQKSLENTYETHDLSENHGKVIATRVTLTSSNPSKSTKL